MQIQHMGVRTRRPHINRFKMCGRGVGKIYRCFFGAPIAVFGTGNEVLFTMKVCGELCINLIQRRRFLPFSRLVIVLSLALVMVLHFPIVAQGAVLKNECARLFYQLHEGPVDKRPFLYFQWKQFNAEVKPGVFKDEVLYQTNTEDNPEMPVIYVKGIWKYYSLLSEFAEALFAKYNHKIRSQLVELVKKVDAQLPLARIGEGTVSNYESHETYATARMFNGSPAFDPSDSSLPLEWMFRIRGLSFNKTKAFLEELRKNKSEAIFELGRYMLDGQKEPRSRSQKLIDLWILNYFLAPNPDAFIFGHVTDSFKLSIFKEKYGLNVFESVPVPADPGDLQAPGAKPEENFEYIVMVKASEMAKVIRLRLGLLEPERN